MNFFNFGGPAAEIDIILSPPERDRSQQPQIAGQQNDLKNGIASSTASDASGGRAPPLYYDGETVAGRVIVKLKKTPTKLEHHGIRVEFVGQIEMYYDRGNHHEFIAMEKMLARPGELTQTTTFPFEFAHVEKPYETYFGANVKLRYFVRATVARRLTDLVKEQDIMVYSIASYPDLSEPIKMEVGIEESLHIEFEYSKSKFHLKDVIIGKIYFLLVRVKIKYMELSILRKELTGYGASNYDTAESVIARYEIMDGAPVRGESIPIRLFLSGYPDLTPTMKDVQKKFSVRYFLNLVLVDEEDRRYFKQQEVILWRKGEKLRRPLSRNYPHGVAYGHANTVGDSYNEAERQIQNQSALTDKQQRFNAPQQQQQQIVSSQQQHQRPLPVPQQLQQPVAVVSTVTTGGGGDANEDGSAQINATTPRKQVFVGASTSQGPAAAARQKAVAAAAAAAAAQQRGNNNNTADFDDAASRSSAVRSSDDDRVPLFAAASDGDTEIIFGNNNRETFGDIARQRQQQQSKFERFDDEISTSTTGAVSQEKSASPLTVVRIDTENESNSQDEESHAPVPRKLQSHDNSNAAPIVLPKTNNFGEDDDDMQQNMVIRPHNGESAGGDSPGQSRRSQFYAGKNGAINVNAVVGSNIDSDTLRASPPPLRSHSSNDDGSHEASPEKFAVPMPPSSGSKGKNFYSRVGNHDEESGDQAVSAKVPPPRAVNLFGDDDDE